MAHKCPAFDCAEAIGADQIACKQHWFLVPKPLRDRIWTLYRREAGSEAHRTAVFDAVGLLADVPTLPALTLIQPWAWAVAEGFKTIENRPWRTTYRGWIAIHAGAKKADRDEVNNVEALAQQTERTRGGDPAAVPCFVQKAANFGHVVGVARVVDCVPVAAVTSPEWPYAVEKLWAFGPWCWRLAGARKLIEPVKLRGSLGLFRMADTDTARVRSQVQLPELLQPKETVVQGVSIRTGGRT